jgi:hypothetical protein
MYRRHILCTLYGAVEGEWGSKLPISLHYLAQGEGQGGGLRSVLLIRSSPPPHTPMHYNTSVHCRGWALKLMYIKLPMYLFFLYINLMILMRANQLLRSLEGVWYSIIYIYYFVDWSAFSTVHYT